MSLYGNIKKIGSASFQFDRKYNTRYAMDNSAEFDGVYAGRYVLVEYGYRFGKDGTDIIEIEDGGAISSEPLIEYVYQSIPEDATYDSSITYYTIEYDAANDTQEYVEYPYVENEIAWTNKLLAHQLFKKIQKITYNLINTEDGSIKIDGIKENESYRQHAEEDLRHYGAVYDSTVWQKTYVEGKDKYVMVAELNALAPKLDITQDAPLEYTVQNKEVPNYRVNGVISGKINDRGELVETVRLTNVKEKTNKAYFDTALDTELTYLLHLPTTLNLEINDDTVDFNENGFNIAYSYPESEGVSTIAWIPKGHDKQGNEIYLDDYDLKNDGNTDNGGNPYALLNGSKYEMDTKMLFMSFPALGNAMNGIYNLIYGKPDPLDDLEHGAMRPYFKRFLNDLILTNRAAVRDRENISHFITYDSTNPLDPYVYITGKIGQAASPALNGYDAVNMEGLEPHEYVEIRFRDDTTSAAYPNNYYKLTSQEYANLPKDDDEVVTSAGEYVLWDILRRQPLEMTVHTPTGDEDPDMEWLKKIPGLADILANADSGLATVLSSIFGYVDPLTGTTRYYLYNDWTISTEDGGSGPAISNKPKIVGGYPQTFIAVENMASRRDILGNPISESAGFMIDYNEDHTTTDHKIGYPHTEIVTSKIFSGGNYVIDYNNWQLVDYITPDIAFTIVPYTPNENASAQEISNQDKIKMSRSGNTITFTTQGELSEYNDGDWVIFDVDTGFSSIHRLKLNDVTFTDMMEAAMISDGADKGHILIKVKASDIDDVPGQYKISAAGFNDAIFTIQYRGVR